MHSRDEILLLFFFSLAIAFRSEPAAAMAASGIKAGYWPSYLSSTFPASSIRFSYFTHVYYAFLQPDPASFEITVTPFDAEAIPSFVTAARDNGVRAMLTVGGGASNLTTFGRLASNHSTRAAFILSSLATARRFGLDGLDLDWEFPADAYEMSLLGDLFTEWRSAIDGEAAACGLPKLLLSAAVYFASSRFLDVDTRSAFFAILSMKVAIHVPSLNYYLNYYTSTLILVKIGGELDSKSGPMFTFQNLLL